MVSVGMWLGILEFLLIISLGVDIYVFDNNNDENCTEFEEFLRQY